MFETKDISLVKTTKLLQALKVYSFRLSMLGSMNSKIWCKTAKMWVPVQQEKRAGCQMLPLVV